MQQVALDLEPSPDLIVVTWAAPEKKDYDLLTGIALCVTGLAALVGVNLPTLVLGAASMLSYVLAYTPLKRVTSLCTVVGAVPGALPPLIGWTAARSTKLPPSQ